MHDIVFIPVSDNYTVLMLLHIYQIHQYPLWRFLYCALFIWCKSSRQSFSVSITGKWFGSFISSFLPGLYTVSIFAGIRAFPIYIKDFQNFEYCSTIQNGQQMLESLYCFEFLASIFTSHILQNLQTFWFPYNWHYHRIFQKRPVWNHNGAPSSLIHRKLFPDF